MPDERLIKRNREVDRTLWIILVLNVLVAAAKLVLGAITGATAVFADGLASFADGAGNVVALIAMRFANQPRDPQHPYGHQKYETYASAAIGAMLVVAAWEVASRAVQALWAYFTAGTVPKVEVTAISFAVMATTLLVNIFVAWWERKQGRKLGSDVLIADSSHTAADVWVTVGVIISLGLVHFGLPLADPIVSLIVAGVIVKTAWEVFTSVNETFSDAARLPAEEVRGFVCSLPEVRGAHNIRTRGTAASFFMDLSVLVDPAMTVDRAHDVAAAVEQGLREHYAGLSDAVVHTEPDTEEQRTRPLLG